MKSAGNWIGAGMGSVLPINVPTDGVFLALIFSRLQDASRLVPISSDILRRGSTGFERLVEELKRELAQGGDVPELRLIGLASMIERVSARFREQGLPTGRSVVVTSESETIYFYPGNGKIRVPVGTSRRPALRRRVLVVDDSLTICKLLRKIIDEDPGLECIGTIQDPRIAEKEIRALKPDVVTMDIHMPEISGIELLRRVMGSQPVPVVLISSLSMSEGGEVLEGLALGAVDYIQKPTANDMAVSIPLIQEKIRSAAGARLQPVSREGSKAPLHSIFTRELDLSNLIAIGASTGGTEAIREVLSVFPEKIPPVLVVQHIPAVFSKAFADRLNGLFPFRVKEGVDGEEICPSTVYIAPGGKQMRLRRVGTALKLCVDDSAPVNRHRPSVDALFQSIADLKLSHVSSCILTGMGGDGAAGLLALRALGANTFAQDEATSVVYGMPREAHRIGAVQSVLPLQEIGRAILKSVERRPARSKA